VPGELEERIEAMLTELDADDVRSLERCGAQIRQWVIETPFPADLEQAIRGAYADLTAGNPRLRLRCGLQLRRKICPTLHSPGSRKVI
jgi:phosphoenolpyruvate synthase (EC 2.7.9.2)